MNYLEIISNYKVLPKIFNGLSCMYNGKIYQIMNFKNFETKNTQSRIEKIQDSKKF